MSSDDPKNRRRVPRRTFNGRVGVLCHGHYSVDKTLQVGEGGLRFLSKKKLKEEAQLICTFQIPNGSIVCVRGVIRYVDVEQGHNAYSYGVQFENLDFHFKRELRNFVAAATQDSIFA